MHKKTLTVYFDGLCHLCSREIEHYRKMKGSERIQFVDITGSLFDAAKEGLDPKRVHQTLHARDESGKLHLGVDAFMQIWARLGSLSWLAAAAKFPPVYLALRGAYSLFARARQWLPRKKCEASPFCEMRPRS